MKKKYFALFAALTLLASCTTSRPNGKCVGVLDDKDPSKAYELSYWNLAVAVFFSETGVVPAIVILKYMECPTNEKH